MTVSILSILSMPSDVELIDSIAYVADAVQGLLIVDMHRPDRPVPLGHIPSHAYALAVQDSIAFVLGDSLWVVDVANPELPTVLSTAAASMYLLPDAVVVTPWLFCEIGGQLSVFDISNPRKTMLQSAFSLPASIYGVAARGDTILASTLAGVSGFSGATLSRQYHEGSKGETGRQNSGWLRTIPTPSIPRPQSAMHSRRRAHVTLTVFNTLGQPVATLVNEEQEAGYHDVRFDGGGLASGVYFYRLKAGEYVATKKLVILR